MMDAGAYTTSMARLVSGSAEPTVVAARASKRPGSEVGR